MMSKKKSLFIKLSEKVLGIFAEDDVKFSVIENLEYKHKSVSKEKSILVATFVCLFYFLQILFTLILENISWNFMMFKNYSKSALRALSGNKTTSIINIIGLSISMSVSVLILLYVLNEVSYDRFHENSRNIYRICMKINSSGAKFDGPGTPAPLGPALMEQYPEVLHSVRLLESGYYISFEDKLFDEPRITFADPTAFDIFSIKVIQGNPETFLDAPFSLVITEEMALKYFGENEPIGKVLKFDDKDNYTVTGVVRKMPENSHFKFNMLASFTTLHQGLREELSRWDTMNYYTYIELRVDTPLNGLNEKYTELLMTNNSEVARTGGTMELYLQPVTKIHLNSFPRGELEPGGNPVFILIIATIALFILLIACVNFMNLSTARSTGRAKEVGMRKVLGANKRKLIFQFLGESMILCFISLIISIVLVQLFLPVFNQFISKELTFNPFNNRVITPGLILLTCFVGIISGSYPAFFLSSFAPVNVLSNRYKTGKGHQLFRNILVSFQYIISITLICCTLVIYYQLSYMKNRNLGYTKDHVLVIPLNGKLRTNYEVFKSKLLQLPGALNASASSLVPGRGRNLAPLFYEGFAQDKPIAVYYLDIDEDYLNTMNMELASGRNFSREFPADKSSSVIINETLARELGQDSPLGKKVRVGRESFTITGVIRDFNFESLHNAIQPHLLKMSGSKWNISVRVKPENLSETIQLMRELWLQLEPALPFEHYFFDDMFDYQYRTELRIGKAFIFFTLIAVFIACLGILGLASFTAEKRTKEIGIHKVLGASAAGIIILLSKAFIKWVLLANVIAWPLSYFLMNTWLRQFAYRISLAAWVFLLSGALALIITLITVNYQAMRAAFSNPAEALRFE